MLDYLYLGVPVGSEGCHIPAVGIQFELGLVPVIPLEEGGVGYPYVYLRGVLSLWPKDPSG